MTPPGHITLHNIPNIDMTYTGKLEWNYKIIQDVITSDACNRLKYIFKNTI